MSFLKSKIVVSSKKTGPVWETRSPIQETGFLMQKTGSPIIRETDHDSFLDFLWIEVKNSANMMVTLI